MGATPSRLGLSVSALECERFLLLCPRPVQNALGHLVKLGGITFPLLGVGACRPTGDVFPEMRRPEEYLRRVEDCFRQFTDTLPHVRLKLRRRVFQALQPVEQGVAIFFS
jgi:hypothetical protein